MNFIAYSLAAVISYLGLVAGFGLAKIAKEEIKPGKKYFVLLQKGIWLIIFIALFVFLETAYLLPIIFIIAYLFSRQFLNSVYSYVIFSGVFYSASADSELFIITSSLIFIYGLPAGSVAEKKQLIHNAIFVPIAVLLFLLF